MFLGQAPPVEYSRLWDNPLSERIRVLRSRGIRVAYYYEQPDSSTFRYRAHNMIQTLNDATTDVSAAWFCEQDLDLVRDLPDLVDVLVVVRSRYSYRLDDLVSRARSRGARVVYDVDDLVCNPDLAPLIAHTLGEDQDRESVWSHWFGHTARIQAAMKLCDRVTVTNDFLAHEVRQVGVDDVRVIPNFMDQEQLAVSADAFGAKRYRRFARDEAVHLGYFSGSTTHTRDFDVVSDPLASLFDADPRLRLLVAGYLDMRGGMSRHADRIERHAMQDFRNLQSLIAATEINLVPLQSNRFTNSKSELKYFEAGAVGTISVASPTFAFARAICAGENGFLAGGADWEKVLTTAVATLDVGGEEYVRMATRAHEHSLETYSWDRQVPAIRAALLES